MGGQLPGVDNWARSVGAKVTSYIAAPLHHRGTAPGGQGADDMLSALSSAAPQLDRDDVASIPPPLLQLLADTRAAVQRDLAARKSPTSSRLDLLRNLTKNLGPLVAQATVAVQETLQVGMLSLGWDVFLEPPGLATGALLPTPEAVLAFLERWGRLGTPVRLATNFTTLNIRAGQEVFKCEAACPNPMCQRLQPDLHQRLQP